MKRHEYVLAGISTLTAFPQSADVNVLLPYVALATDETIEFLATSATDPLYR